MSQEALIEDLRQKSEARIAQLRADAEEQVEKRRKQKQRELEASQADVLAHQESEAEKVTAPILHEARRSALEIEVEAMRRLADRLYALGVDLLDQLRGSDYETSFAGLVKELPQIAWETVRVNPEDRKLAEKYFPDCNVDENPEVIGGFLVSTDGGKYKVVNTLKRRLEIGWPAILPQLLHDIIREDNAQSAV